MVPGIPIGYESPMHPALVKTIADVDPEIAELITAEEELSRMWILRKLLHGMEDSPAIEFLIDKLKDTKTNEEFFDSMKRK